MTLEQIFLARDMWTEVVQYKLSPKVSYKIAKYMTKIIDELKIIGEERERLIKEHGTKDETDPNKIAVSKESLPMFVEEWSKFISVDSELEPLDYSLDSFVNDLAKCKENKVDPSTLMLLVPFFKQGK